MSRQHSIELVERYYSAFNSQDWLGMLSCVSEDVAHHVNEGQARRGHAAFADFLAHMDRCYSEWLDDVVVMANEDGSRAAAEFVVNGTYDATDTGLPEARGQRYRLPAGAFFEVADGEIARVTTYYNLADWTRQVSA